jgi:hypothetical protein
VRTGRGGVKTQPTGNVTEAYFWDTLLSDVKSLIIYGGIHVKEMGCYRMLSKRFPYAIYYEVKNNSAYVVAVLPMLRDPKWIRGKLEERS